VWKVLGAIRNEFSRYNEVVDKIAKQINRAATTVEALGGRTKSMNQKLREVETLPDGTAQELLGLSQEALDTG
jgi:DNA recombination protein RmuC